MNKTSYLAFFTITFSFLCSLPAYSQTPYDISIVLPANIKKIQNSPDMVSALKVLQLCTDHSFIIEGAPLRPIGQKSLSSYIKIKDYNKTHFADVMIQLAKFYDYSVSEYKNTYIFTKMFTRPEDFPEIPIKELRLFLKNTRLLTNSFSAGSNYTSSPNPTFLRLSQSLSASELSLLKFGESRLIPKELQNLQPDHQSQPEEGAINVETIEEYEKIQLKMLKYSQLSGNIQSILKSIMYSEIIGNPATNIGRGLSLIDELSVAETTFSWVTTGKFQCFTCSRKVPSGRTYTTPWGPSRLISWNFGSSSILQSPLPEGDLDPERPMPVDYDTSGTPLPRPLETVGMLTLSQLCSQLNTKLKIARFTVDPILATKRLVLIDSGKTSPEELWQSISQIYNLRIEEVDNKLNLTTPEIKPGKTWEEASQQIESIFPGPLLRFCQYAQVNVAVQAEKERRQQLIDLNLPGAEKMPISRSTTYDVLRGMGLLKKKIIHRLRIQLEPRAKAKKDQTLLWSELTDEEKELTTFFFSCEAVPHAFKLAYTGLPAFVKNPQDCIISGRIYESQGRKFFRIGIRTPDSQFGVSSTAVIESPPPK